MDSDSREHDELSEQVSAVEALNVYQNYILINYTMQAYTIFQKTTTLSDAMTSTLANRF